MRETRTCGSEGGEVREGLSYPYVLVDKSGLLNMFTKRIHPTHT